MKLSYWVNLLIPSKHVIDKRYYIEDMSLHVPKKAIEKVNEIAQ